MATLFKALKYKGVNYVMKINMEDYLKLPKRTISLRFSKKLYAYYKMKGSTKMHHIHRVITDCPHDMFVDHINGDGLDNRALNLRVVTMQQNNQNATPRKKSTSKYRGVSYDSVNKKWRARISCDGKKHEVGSFVKENDAALAYNKKAKELFGEYSYQNKIKGEL